jgi:hypothetical protein
MPAENNPFRNVPKPSRFGTVRRRRHAAVRVVGGEGTYLPGRLQWPDGRDRMARSRAAVAPFFVSAGAPRGPAK